MTYIRITELRQSDLDEIEPLMRDIDRFEFDVMSAGRPLHENLKSLMDRSVRARAARVDGRLIAIYGVVRQTALSRTGNPWMAATSALEEPYFRRIFIERTHREIEWMAQGFDHFWNLVSIDNKIAIRWLKWIGFKFDDEPVDVFGHQFKKFQIGG